MKKKLIVPISMLLSIIIVVAIYVSYGYVSARITNNEIAQKQKFTNQKLEIEYSDGKETLTSNNTSFIPGSTITKTFTVKNTGNIKLNFKLNLTNVTNTFTRNEDITYELYLEDELLISNIYPSTNTTIAYNQTINKNETKNYTLKIIYNNSEENQIIDSGATIDGKISFDQQINNLTNLKILGNSIQSGTPSIDTPVEIESVGDKTVNLFEYKAPEIANGTIIEELDNGAIVQGNRNLYENINDYMFDYGWYRPADTTIGGNGVILYSGDVVTVSADVTLLEVGLKERELGTKIYLYSRAGDGYANETKYSLELNKTKRISYTFEINDFRSGTIFYPVFTLNSHKMKIENIQIEKGTTATEYEPYGMYKVPVEVRSKNLINISIDDMYGGYYSDTSGGVLLSLYTNKYMAVNKLINVLPSTKYTLSSNLNIYTIWLYEETGTDLYSNIGSLQQVIDYNNDSNKSTFNTTANTKYIRISLVKINQIEDNSDFKWIMLEKGDGTEEYEKYADISKFDIYLNEPLRKIGEYEDYIDLEEGKVYRYVEVIDDTGTLSLEESLRGLDTPIIEEIDVPSIYSINADLETYIDTTISATIEKE